MEDRRSPLTVAGAAPDSAPRSATGFPSWLRASGDVKNLDAAIRPASIARVKWI